MTIEQVLPAKLEAEWIIELREAPSVMFLLNRIIGPVMTSHKRETIRPGTCIHFKRERNHLKTYTIKCANTCWVILWFQLNCETLLTQRDMEERDEENRWEKHIKWRPNADRMINVFQNRQNHVFITAYNGTHTFSHVSNILSWYRDIMWLWMGG